MSQGLPDHGGAAGEMLKRLGEQGRDDPPCQDARLWSLICCLDPAHAHFLNPACEAFSSANGLDQLQSADGSSH